MHEPMLTIDETARLLRVSPRTVYRLVRAGRLPARHVSPRLLRVPRAAVAALVELDDSPAEVRP